ncbi:hypothetical protein AYJ66_06445 [Dietzia cinnamea]|nr:hypothetical protein AYJ66_06445 [Dietzia cinnamea]
MKASRSAFTAGMRGLDRMTSTPTSRIRRARIAEESQPSAEARFSQVRNKIRGRVDRRLA